MLFLKTQRLMLCMPAPALKQLESAHCLEAICKRQWFWNGLLNNYWYKEVLWNWIYSLSNNSTWMGIPVLIFIFISVCSTFYNSIQSFLFSVIKSEVLYLKAHYIVFYNEIYWNLWSISLNIYGFTWDTELILFFCCFLQLSLKHLISQFLFTPVNLWKKKKKNQIF